MIPNQSHGEGPVVLGTGLVALDVVISPGEPVHALAGGTCANVMAILSFLGWRSYPFARLNGDSPSIMVRHDLESWGVNLDFIGLTPSAATPVIIHEVFENRREGRTHRFSLRCPDCNSWFPSFRPVRADSVEDSLESVPNGDVFFFDRVSRGALRLAESTADAGGLVVFEPSAKTDPRLLREAMAVAHLIKYSSQRMPTLFDDESIDRAPFVEVETRGGEGLRYRTSARACGRREYFLPAVAADAVVDTAGSGDWCTGGMLYGLKSAAGGGSVLDLPGEEVEGALRLGQAAAAWNCGFSGARRGMYGVTASVLLQRLSEMLGGSPEQAPMPPNGPVPTEKGIDMICEHCAAETAAG